MAYGDAIATMSTYGDDIFCLKCATYIYSNMGDRKGNDFFFWTRDLSRQEMHAEIGQDEIHDFIDLVKQGKVRDGLSEDTDSRISLLREGHLGEQEIIDKNNCKKCLIALSDLCTDY